jgi:hypothetical protein
VVISTTRFTVASVIVRVLPGHERPSARLAARHPETAFSGVMFSSSAIWRSRNPSAARYTIRARSEYSKSPVEGSLKLQANMIGEASARAVSNSADAAQHRYARRQNADDRSNFDR